MARQRSAKPRTAVRIRSRPQPEKAGPHSGPFSQNKKGVERVLSDAFFVLGKPNAVRGFWRLKRPHTGSAELIRDQSLLAKGHRRWRNRRYRGDLILQQMFPRRTFDKFFGVNCIIIRISFVKTGNLKQKRLNLSCC